MRALIDLTGQRFGRLTVQYRVDNGPRGETRWLCLCDCNNTVIVTTGKLRSGHTQSCGCMRDQSHLIHGETGTPLFLEWCGIRNRCNDSNNPYYGARNISVCNEWNNDYIAFRDWSLEHGYKEGLTIDRLNNDMGYEPDNCKWSTAKQQANNRRSNLYYEYNNEIHTLMEWCEILNLPYGTIYSRIHRDNYSFEQAITTPIRTHN